MRKTTKQKKWNSLQPSLPLGLVATYKHFLFILWIITIFSQFTIFFRFFNHRSPCLFVSLAVCKTDFITSFGISFLSYCSWNPSLCGVSVIIIDFLHTWGWWYCLTTCWRNWVWLQDCNIVQLSISDELGKKSTFLNTPILTGHI